MNKHDKMNGQRGINRDMNTFPILSTRFIVYVRPRIQGVV